MGNLLVAPPPKLSKGALEKYQQDLRQWGQTIAEVNEHEKQAWKDATPGPCRLAVYWLQTLLCEVEQVPRMIWHLLNVMLMIPIVFLVSAALQAHSCWKESRAEGKSQTVQRKDRYRVDRDYESSLLPSRQMNHHMYWFRLYFSAFPTVLHHNLLNPSQPFFADGVDVTLFRPQKPRDPRHGGGGGGGGSSDCCSMGGCCGPDADCCQRLQNRLQAVAIRLIRSSFFFLGGYHSFQCGSCLGPCVRTPCYDPCVGDDTEKGRCMPCEVDEIRLRRWAREAHDAKVARSLAFFDARPSLMRPSEALLQPENAAIENKKPGRGMPMPIEDQKSGNALRAPLLDAPR
eukprot:TRINITY_DN4000_c0_g1_i1.p1 TRINITY_DN4000_c0_g1~~TRINITY_DN4000_c0_g1_i1.p1  ORF type:complete len:344 (-),score=29.39 TRINITY_DN4000_c0_g1_i1:124-1155(-)